MQIDRRAFLTGAAGAFAGAMLPRFSAAQGSGAFGEVASTIESLMAKRRVAGVSACAVKGDAIVWSQAFGYADVANRIPMTADTIQNIASISKTVTGAAVMQLVERGEISLDADVNKYLPFSVRHPMHPDSPMTVQQLMTHTSAIVDGPAYGASYACGDPTVSLRDWVEGYFTPDGTYYDAAQNWAGYAPGERRTYSNVGYGLLGHLVETITGEDFADHTRRTIFEPLDMASTGWRLADVDRARYAIPYRYMIRKPKNESRTSNLIQEVPEGGGFAPHCLYSFPNYPDGLVRTSATELARFQLAMLNGGAYDGGRILQASSVDGMLQPYVEEPKRPGFAQGLTWVRNRADEGVIEWSHSGGDPGVSTLMVVRPEAKTGSIVLCNSPAGDLIDKATRAIFEALRDA